MVGLALASRSRSTAEQGDLQALKQIEERLVSELGRLGDIKKRAESIRRSAEAIEKDVEVGQRKLTKIIEDAEKTLIALNVDFSNDEAERGSPIQLSEATPENSCELMDDQPITNESSQV